MSCPAKRSATCRMPRACRTHACQIWAKCNVIDPRPTREIKTSLAAYTGKTTKQVGTGEARACVERRGVTCRTPVHETS